VSSPVRYQVEDEVATLVFSRGSERNLIDAEFLDQLGDSCRAAQDDPAVRVIVLTNEGSVFCGGADLRSRGRDPRYTLSDILESIVRSPKPVVGRIAGHAMGGGVGLAAACDLSFACETATFGFPEVRLGVIPAMVSVVCLPKLGRSQASELMLTGERFSARRAADVGLITGCVSAADLDATVTRVVDSLRAGGPAALAACKDMIDRVPGMDRADAFAWAAETSRRLFEGPEASEGIAAFRDKRTPSWAPRPAAAGEDR
jgi:methylglutaconyl-CoA hydratase